jgi:hypothetical protein
MITKKCVFLSNDYMFDDEIPSVLITSMSAIAVGLINWHFTQIYLYSVARLAIVIQIGLFSLYGKNANILKSRPINL